MAGGAQGEGPRGPVTTVVAIEARVHDALRLADTGQDYVGAASFVFVRLRVRLSNGREGQGLKGRFLVAEVTHFLTGALRDHRSDCR